MMSLPLNQILLGDCIEVLQSFPENSVDLVVTDPPYGMGFMGKEWDKALPPKEAFKEMYRVLKPGALAFVMSSPRQDLFCRMGVLLEDAGFELSQSFISWIYKTGFPKAYDVSKGIDKRNNRTNEDFIKLGKYLKEKRIERNISTIQLGEHFKTHPDRVNHGGCVSNWENALNIPTPEQWIKLKQILELDNEFDYIIERVEAERKKIGVDGRIWDKRKRTSRERVFNTDTLEKERGIGFGDWDITEPSLVDSKKWDGWKAQTGLKPALEPIFMVNKPFSESTIVDNVLRWGTGAINVDACRIPFQNDENLVDNNWWKKDVYESARSSTFQGKEHEIRHSPAKGRFPANLLVSDDALDDGETTKSGLLESHHKITSPKTRDIYGEYNDQLPEEHTTYGDEGSKSRYFDLDAWAKHHGILDIAKPSTSERDYGLKGKKKHAPIGNYKGRDLSNPKNVLRPGMPDRFARNIHPTVKPIKLMAYLIELGCPRDGVVLDPFVGSGTTCIAAKRLCRRYIGIEIEAEYHLLAQSRVDAYPEPLEWFT